MDALPLHSIHGLHSLQDRQARAVLQRELAALGALPAPLAPERIRDLINFEVALYRLIGSDKRWFFAQIDSPQTREFARDMQLLHAAAASTLHGLIARRGEWSRSDDDPLLQRLVGFALCHLAAAAKWCLLRHEAMRPTIWPALHALYVFSEQAGFATYPMRLFGDEGSSRTTVQALYLRVLLLDFLNSGSLTPAQLEIADGWLAEWSVEHGLDLDFLPALQSLRIDLEADEGLRIAVDGQLRPSQRYLRVDSLGAQIESVRAEMRAGRLFNGRGVVGLFPIAEHVALLGSIERLYQSVLNVRTASLEARTRVADRRCAVQRGFAAALAAISGEDTAPAAKPAPAPAAAPMKFGGIELTLEQIPDAPSIDDAFGSDAAPDADTHAGQWKIHDLSSGGIGLLLPRQQAESVVLGELLALKPDGIEHWMIGTVVRKLPRHSAEEALLGVEILCLRPLPILLSRYAHARDVEPDPMLAPIAAIYLPAADADGSGDSLLLPSGDFGLKTLFSLATRAARFRVHISRVLRKGSDWLGLRFEVIARKDWPAADSRTHR